MKNILIQICTEELPAIPFLNELDNIKTKMMNVLEKYSVEFSNLQFFYTPRRFVFCFNAKEFCKDTKLEFIGAPKELAYQDSKLSKAALAFMQKAQISEDELSFKEIKGKECLYCEKIQKGKALREIAKNIVDDFLASLNFGKSMRWAAFDFTFIRPITAISFLIDDENINFNSYAINSSKSTFVHRNVSMQALTFNTQNDFFTLLKNSKVILNQDERRQMVLNQIAKIEQENNVNVELDLELLEEVVAITEYPNALLGSFDEEFLKIPPEVIITSMKDNQRYFAVRKNNKLSNHFLAVSNSFNDDLSLITKGNEKVLRARLSDALFFYEQDLKCGLEPKKLENTIYLKELGSIADKSKREEEIAIRLARLINYQDDKQISIAINLSKADLKTQMVAEFPELQGIIGSYYAKAMGYNDEISLAIYEQYLPLKDKMPSTKLSTIVALASKIDTLMALFSINKIPNGNKDPYALRRAALGVLKIILHNKFSFDFKDFINELKDLYSNFNIENLLNFIKDRFYALYDVNNSYIKAVLNTNNNNFVSLDENIKSLIFIANSDDFKTNLSTFKRLVNIIKEEINYKIDESLFEQEEEKNLFKAFKNVNLNSSSEERLREIFSLKDKIDAFFEKVMINVENEKIKNNRLALINEIAKPILQIANLKEISYDD